MEKVFSWRLVRRYLAAVCLGLWLQAAGAPGALDDDQPYEIGTIAQDDYSNAAGPCGLAGVAPATWSGFCDGFSVALGYYSLYGYTQIAPFPLRELAATDQQVDRFAQNLPETVDVFVWTGHVYLCDPDGVGPGGPTDRDKGAALHFMSEHGGPGDCYNWDSTNVNHNEVRLGNECEVGVFLTCNFLRNMAIPALKNKIRYMMHGSHLILGYASCAYFSTYEHEVAYGLDLGRRLMGDLPGQEPQKIVLAWRDASYAAQHTILDPAYNPHYSRAVYWELGGDCRNDYLVGNVRGYSMGAHPPPCTSGNLDDFDEMTNEIW